MSEAIDAQTRASAPADSARGQATDGSRDLPGTTGAAETAVAAPSPALEDRYGTGRRGRIDRRFGWGAVAVLLAAGVGFLLWSGWEETGRIETQDIGFTKTGEFDVSVKFTVSAPPQTQVACAVEALSTSKAVVGWKVLELPVTEQRSHTITAQLRTTTDATAAHVKECWVVEG